jgi:hypothetical protein
MRPFPVLILRMTNPGHKRGGLVPDHSNHDVRDGEDAGRPQEPLHRLVRPARTNNASLSHDADDDRGEDHEGDRYLDHHLRVDDGQALPFIDRDERSACDQLDYRPDEHGSELEPAPSRHLLDECADDRGETNEVGDDRHKTSDFKNGQDKLQELLLVNVY